MNRIDEINRERILWCCAERGVTADQLAHDVGISAATMAKFLADECGLTYPQLKRIADYFGRGVLFFAEDGPVDANAAHTVQYRTLTGQKPDLSFRVRKLIESVERQRELYLALRDELQPGDFPVFRMPTVPNRDPSAAAVAARVWLGLQGVNTFESYRAAVQRKGILVFRSNGYAGAWQIPRESPILGFSLWDDRCPVIFVRKTVWETQQTFTLMHELGHLLLHRQSSIDDDADMHARQGHEAEANAFAGALLVPDDVLRGVRDQDRPQQPENFDQWLVGPRRALGVSTEVILRRLLDAGRLPQDLYVAYRAYVARLPAPEDEGGNRAFRHREPKHIFGDVFVRTVLHALQAQRITLTKASSYLDGIKLSDIRQLEQHLAAA